MGAGVLELAAVPGAAVVAVAVVVVVSVSVAVAVAVVVAVAIAGIFLFRIFATISLTDGVPIVSIASVGGKGVTGAAEGTC